MDIEAIYRAESRAVLATLIRLLPANPRAWLVSAGAQPDEALKIAAGWPSARLGSIEVRPIEPELRAERRYA